MNRRVAVTGVGLVSAVGVGTEECWTALQRGRSGIGPISHFDASGFPCRIAGEVSGFDPRDFVSPRDVRKMGRFIFFAIAASEYAMNMSGLQVTAANSDRVGVYVGSGIGGFDVIEREHKKLLKAGPRRVTPFFISVNDREFGFGAKSPSAGTPRAPTRLRRQPAQAVPTRWGTRSA